MKKTLPQESDVNSRRGRVRAGAAVDHMSERREDALQVVLACVASSVVNYKSRLDPQLGYSLAALQCGAANGLADVGCCPCLSGNNTDERMIQLLRVWYCWQEWQVIVLFYKKKVACLFLVQFFYLYGVKKLLRTN